RGGRARRPGPRAARARAARGGAAPAPGAGRAAAAARAAVPARHPRRFRPRVPAARARRRCLSRHGAAARPRALLRAADGPRLAPARDPGGPRHPSAAATARRRMMSPELTLLSGLLIGLFGSVHCVGMCGGIAGTLTLGARLPGGRSLRALAPFLLAYNLGRIGSYAVAGAVVAGLGAQAFGWAAPERAHVVARLVSGGFALALGLYLGGWWYGLGALERAGARLWRRLAPLARRWLPVDRLPKALALGLLWGWLPCGMV